ncbi:uncharacterized protein Bfra_004364 [Botrytis fragariae]|uniref:Uncharacterized protein n=1 Tax=Botrytis fragariae TaxID=1964551 RepID=A0A8H6AV44_9HELO|nr:uncharacterized protein Bfra_004364 [Botrytis fragariae]KAF5874358.1 hypothetical protein Bfra_004364 [Botrytis fragariae]
MVSSAFTKRKIDTTDSLNQKAHIFNDDYKVKRSAMIGALEILADEQDLKRQIAEKGSGIQETQSLNRGSYDAMGKLMVIDTEIMEFLLEAEEGEEKVEKPRAFLTQKTKIAEH